MKEYTEREKELMYDNGEFWFELPPVCTNLWRKEDWIKWVDICGKWLPKERVK